MPSVNPRQTGALNLHESIVPLGGPWGDRVLMWRDTHEAGVSTANLMWVLHRLTLTNPLLSRMARRLWADFAARVLHAFERSNPTDLRPRQAILALRRFGEDADFDRKRLRAAFDAAWECCRSHREGTPVRSAAYAGCAIDARAAFAVAENAVILNGEAEDDWQFRRFMAWLKDRCLEDVPLPDRPLTWGR